MDGNCSVAFLGVADHASIIGPGLDVFRLTTEKRLIVYPSDIKGLVWVFMISKEYLEESVGSFEIIVKNKSGENIGKISVSKHEKESDQEEKEQEIKRDAVVGDEPLVFSMKNSNNYYALFRFPAVLDEPGCFDVVLDEQGCEPIVLGSVEFSFRSEPPLTPDQVKGLQSDPTAMSTVRIILGCTKCGECASVYTSLTRNHELEKEGDIWQYDVPDYVSCKCGNKKYDLHYIKESLHAFLLKSDLDDKSSLSFLRNHSHGEVVRVVNKYLKLLDTESKEQPVQKFIEDNAIILAKFNAKRLFYKPRILGKYEADFVVLDAGGCLWFIELERPSIQLFRKDGHPTQALLHAYQQVTDWLDEYRKNSGAVLDGLGLTPESVRLVRGMVIAGRREAVPIDVLQRHHALGPYKEIDLLTCDDLAAALLEISKKVV